MASRRGIRLRRRGRKDSGDRLDELTERTRAEARALSRKRRIEARRKLRAQAQGLEAGTRVRGAGYETRRRLRPVYAPVAALLSRLAPYVTRTLLFVVQLIAALIALIVELVQVVVRRLGRLFGVSGVTLGDWLRRHVTPVATVAFVGACAAVLLGVAQFSDYHGVAVDAPNYAGPIGREAPAPLTGTESAGSAHLWVLLPIAAAALLLTFGAYRGDGRCAAGMVVCGVLGIAVALAIDLPQGLDAGRAGLAFYGAEAQLLGGFWVEMAASATLILCGCLLPLYSRGAARPGGRRRDERRSRESHHDVGGIPPGLQAES
ncbi:MAG TPA: hypothetical protein VKA88_02410 [Solirubrobacterales bacterium]|nr:hypothetical protein [Solirubrobacterales bacterium]